jgi:DNA-binding transcriptional regulator LsrR (DeoR family)
MDASPSGPGQDGDVRDSDVKTRVAWLYYMEGLTQDSIAEKLGISRLRVLRMLAASRQDGTVQIRVVSRLSECVGLERQIETAFGIGQAIVIPAPEDEQRLPALIGAAAGGYIADSLRHGMRVGLGWGNSLRSSLLHIPQRNVRDLTVVSLLGGLTRAAGVNPAEFAWRFADMLGAECYLLTAPVYVADEATHTALRAHPGIEEVFAQARRVDLALVSVGDLSPGSTLARFGLLSWAELAELARAGAVADVLCRFVDRAGQVLDHPLNRRVIAVHPEDLRETPNVVLASGGWSKVTALRAAVRLLRPQVLITDTHAAEGLLTHRDDA